MYCEPTQPGPVWEKCDQIYTAISGILPYIVFYTNRTVYYMYTSITYMKYFLQKY